MAGENNLAKEIGGIRHREMSISISGKRSAGVIVAGGGVKSYRRKLAASRK
jgi:hypothetical protein